MVLGVEFLSKMLRDKLSREICSDLSVLPSPMGEGLKTCPPALGWML